MFLAIMAGRKRVSCSQDGGGGGGGICCCVLQDVVMNREKRLDSLNLTGSRCPLFMLLYPEPNAPSYAFANAFSNTL
jgi:hypothetical protein